MAAANWYYAKGQERHGPVTADQLRHLAATGQVLPTDFVFQEGMHNWVLASKVQGLFSTSAAAPASQSATAHAPASEPAKPSSSQPAASRSRGGHPLGGLLGFLRSMFPASMLSGVARVLAVIGHWALVFTAVAWLCLAVFVAIKESAFGVLVHAIGLSLLVLVVQYSAYRAVGAADRLVKASPSVLSSTMLPDSLSLLLAGLGVMLGLGLLNDALATSSWQTLLIGMGTFACFEYIACVAANVEGLNIAIDEKCSVGNEGIGVLALFLKLLIRIVPVAYGAGTATMAVVLVIQGVRLMNESSGTAFAYVSMVRLLSTILGLGLLPLGAYVVYLVYFVTVDFVRATLAIPGKLAALATALAQPKADEKAKPEDSTSA